MPFVGDFAGTVLSFWLIFYIRRTNLIEKNKSWAMIVEMTLNIIIDFLV